MGKPRTMEANRFDQRHGWQKHTLIFARFAFRIPWRFLSEFFSTMEVRFFKLESVGKRWLLQCCRMTENIIGLYLDLKLCQGQSVLLLWFSYFGKKKRIVISSFIEIVGNIKGCFWVSSSGCQILYYTSSQALICNIFAYGIPSTKLVFPTWFQSRLKLHRSHLWEAVGWGEEVDWDPKDIA